MAIQSAALLASKNAQLRLANNKQKRKREAKKAYIAHGGVLTIAEGQEQARSKESGQSSGSGSTDAEPPEPKRRAPGKCSVCGSEEHNARTCSNK